MQIQTDPNLEALKALAVATRALTENLDRNLFADLLAVERCPGDRSQIAMANTLVGMLLPLEAGAAELMALVTAAKVLRNRVRS